MRSYLLLTTVTALFLVGGTCDATTLIYAPLETQTAESRVVVRGQIVDAEARWDEQRRTVFTHVEIFVAESYKGPFGPGSTVNFQFLGGSAGGFTVRYFGMPVVRSGQEMVLFLAETEEQTLVPWGLKQSVMPVLADSATGEARVWRDLGGVSLVEEYLRGEQPFQEMSLIEFSQRVRTLVHQGGTR